MTRPPTKPSDETIAANGRRIDAGTSTAASSATNDVPSSTRIVEIENQSTCGVEIT